MLSAGDETTTPVGPRSGRGRPFPAPTDGIPLLIVDDDPNFCAAMTRALASTRFLAFVVRGGVDALRLLARAAPFEHAPRPAFVVLDFNLPDLNAPAVLAQPHGVDPGRPPRGRGLTARVVAGRPDRFSRDLRAR